jgi:hypothetical protein
MLPVVYRAAIIWESYRTLVLKCVDSSVTGTIKHAPHGVVLVKLKFQNWRIILVAIFH